MAKHTAKCNICQESFEVSNMHKVKSFSHGHFFLCDTHHLERLQMSTYSEENMTEVHKEKKHGMTISIECELVRRPSSSELFREWGFIATHDGTVAVEYKSPIWKSKNGLKQMFRSMEKIAPFGRDLAYGTHLNIGHKDFSSIEMDYVRRFYHSLFIPLCEAMKEDTHATEELHGRGFMGWAEDINKYTNATNHENFVNVQHKDWMEFRMCKFIDTDQYFNLIQMYTEMMATLMNNFVAHFNDETGAKAKEYRTHKASITAQKFVKIFKKYASKI